MFAQLTLEVRVAFMHDAGPAIGWPAAMDSQPRHKEKHCIVATPIGTETRLSTQPLEIVEETK